MKLKIASDIHQKCSADLWSLRFAVLFSNFQRYLKVSMKVLKQGHFVQNTYFYVTKIVRRGHTITYI